MKRFTFLALLFPMFCFGQLPEPMPNTYVNDFANVLNAEQIHTLNEKILSIEKKSSVQIAVLLLNELPENYSIEDYALEVGRKWHVGNAKNGLVYVAAINQRKQRLEVAGSLEGDIPDVTALEITDNIKPFFRNKDYYGGINALLDGINSRVDPVAKEQLKLLAIEQEKKNENTKDGFITFFLWLSSLAVGFVFVRFIVLRNYFKRKKEKKEADEEKERQSNYTMPLAAGLTGYAAGRYSRPSYNNDSYIPPTSTPGYSSGSSSDSSSSSSNDSSYGNWGSGSSDSGSSSSDSGFSGGGSSNDW